MSRAPIPWTEFLLANVLESQGCGFVRHSGLLTGLFGVVPMTTWPRDASVAYTLSLRNYHFLPWYLTGCLAWTARLFSLALTRFMLLKCVTEWMFSPK